MDNLTQWLSEVFGGLVADTFGMVVDPARRIFLPGLAVTLVLAVAVTMHTHRSEGFTGALRRCFTKRVWLHGSSRLDVKLIFANSFFRLILVVPFGVTAFGLANGVVTWLDGVRGIPNGSGWSDLTVAGVYTVVLFVCWDLSRYVLHRLAHEVPFLWDLHKVHHSAEVMTPLTLYRVHPIERILFWTRGIVVTGVITGVFFHFFRDRSVQLELLGINAFGFLFNALGANLRHTHVWLSYGRFVEHVLLSPAQHQVHHSVEVDHQQSNYGVCLAIWDFLFGSLLTTTSKSMGLRFGLAPEDQNHDPRSLVSALLEPLSGREAVDAAPAEAAAER
ncbi:MAG: sterol desaturase family protein [Deltaproteobacteria bacterium]|nr:MAG: sterol desaturase family protein [Deltaproteobacteria bacterium]